MGGAIIKENVIEQLKNGVKAMRMPVDDLVSNWAYMVMAALAWNLKAWYGLLVPDRNRGLELCAWNFGGSCTPLSCCRFRSSGLGARLYRSLGYNGWLKDFFATFKHITALEAG